VERRGANDRLGALSAAFRAFAEITSDSGDLLETVARAATELPGDGCVVVVVDEAGLTSNAAWTRSPEALRVMREALGQLGPGGPLDGPALIAEIVRTGKPLVIEASSVDELVARAEGPFKPWVRALGLRRLLVVPLQVRGRLLGALTLLRWSPEGVPFDELDLEVVTTIGDHAAMAIANAQLLALLETERRQRREAEKQAQTCISLIECSTDMISMANFDGTVLFVNAAGRDLLGIPLERDVQTMTLGDFHVPDGLASAAPLHETGSWHGEGVLRHQLTGELIPMQVSSVLLRDAEGKSFGFATVQHDLRATKRLERELRQAQKMEALGRLAGGIAHDFNNLLTVIMSYGSIISKTLTKNLTKNLSTTLTKNLSKTLSNDLALRAPNDARMLADVEQIERAAQRAAELTRQLLAFSRRQVEPKPLELGATVQQMEPMIRRLVGEDIVLNIVVGTDRDSVMVDAGQVEQVVMNLVVNARDAMRGGGTLTLETARIALTEGTPELPAGRYSMLAITDTGTGLDEGTKARLFEPFFTTKEPSKGTGLGLATVMGIVQQSGGHITVETELGRGSSFRVYLPALAGPPPTPTTPMPRTVTPLHGVQRIFVVEDEVEVRTLIVDVLRSAGYDVIEARDGEHALEVATTTRGEIHLLLTDVIMPRLGGPQVAVKLRERWPMTRVLFMSGYTDDKLGDHGVLGPDVELIQKPLTPEGLEGLEGLVERVRQLLAKGAPCGQH
jgi:PAS domain S-box-containing protein